MTTTDGALSVIANMYVKGMYIGLSKNISKFQESGAKKKEQLIAAPFSS